MAIYYITLLKHRNIFHNKISNEFKRKTKEKPKFNSLNEPKIKLHQKKEKTNERNKSTTNMNNINNEHIKIKAKLNKNMFNMTNNSFLHKKEQNSDTYFKDLFDDNYLKENEEEINQKLKSLNPERRLAKLKSEM